MSQSDPDQLFLQLDGYEGPLDLLLDLARAQKVDLEKISILGLVEQYLAVIEGARKIRLELAADWLVMAAWLTWLKSRLLLPHSAEAEDAEQAAGTLASRLADLQAIRAAALWLNGRPQLGQDVFARGLAEDFTEIDRSRLRTDLPGLLSAYLAALRRAGGKRQYAPKKMTYFSVQDALKRLANLLGSLPDWASLTAFLPDDVQSGLPRRAAMSSTLIAGLEMARSGMIALRQDQNFGPILVRRAESQTDGS
ncbi:MAG: segregation/condensation protein A [Rhodospirillales bacterium 20-60-12]|jgi:segregation and condensation protein A|nr:MAG: segregation/condensation protein A [Rhodospirillales bacterium 20-60-12]HQT68242.1 ScpA family protein [Acetobacteraceae bacterium]HQU01781.1 ScpA family protein [Acetobacteraceae bacterium]